MAGAQRFAIALLAGLIIFSAIPHSNAETNDGHGLIIEINEQDFNEYYLIGESLSLSPTLYNPSSTVEIKNNPSCDYFFTVTNDNDVVIFSSIDRCRNQVQSVEINQGELIDLMTHEWDFKDNNGDEIATGTYTINTIHSTMGISDSTYVQFYGNSTLSEEVELKLNVVELPSVKSNTYLIQGFLHNPTANSIDLADENCVIVLEYQSIKQIFTDCFKGTTILHPQENIYSANHVIEETWLENLDDLSIYILGDFPEHKINTPEIKQFENNATINDGNIGLSKLQWQLNDQSRNPSLTISAEYQNQAVIGDTGCELEIFIVSDFGEVYTNEIIDVCNLTDRVKENQNGNFVVDLHDWQLTNQEGCMVDFGKYTIIVGNAYHHTSVDFFQDIPDDTAGCIDNGLDLDISNTISADFLYSTVKISGSQNIRLVAECMVVIEATVHSIEEYISKSDFCEYTSGNFISSPSGIYEIQEKIQLTGLEDSEMVSASYKVSFERTVSFSETIYLESGEPTINPKFVYQIAGTWDMIDYDGQQCWMVSAPNSAYILKDNSGISNWGPKQSWYGEYLITEHQYDSSFCAQFGLPIISINEIFIEENPNDQGIIKNPVTAGDEETIPITEIAIYGVASSSILLGLLVFISNTESLRIPLTSAGLWIFALVGKTHETSDGRFQRGRLIGYLTANPGCHFRALMAALQMSNGQITHHLRLLENQELIWRINDGRFVRYYPLNNSLYPGMNPDDLPVPLLSPDPKSLQGKILTLLDDEHQIGEFPTQSELAKKLEKSQQLISHHLRTLQKYGLVEKRKMGIKNRYKLTKEALFLLETDMEYIKIRD